MDRHYVGIFVFNCTYNYLLENQSHAAQNLRHFINYNLNFFLFICLIIGFISSRWENWEIRISPLNYKND